MICPRCGTENGDSSLKCVKCWKPLKPAESGPYLGSGTKLPEKTPSEKLPPVKIRRMLSILVLIAVLFSVLPSLIENIGKMEDIKEKLLSSPNALLEGCGNLSPYVDRWYELATFHANSVPTVKSKFTE